MEVDCFSQRRERLRRLMRERNLAAMLVFYAPNRYYLSGFELHDGQCNESSGCLVLSSDGKDWLCTDSRYEEAAGNLWDKERILIYSGPFSEALNGLLKKALPKGAVGIEAEHLSHAFVQRLEPGLALEEADGLVERLRMVKDGEEIRSIEAAVALNHRLLEWLPGILLPGRDEAGIAWEIEKFYREHGASELSFSSIVAKDANAALPHYAPDVPAVLEKNCLVLVDEGCRLGRYCSDQTRTFWVGDSPSGRFREMLGQVQEAQRKAIAEIRPGISGRDVHALAVASFASCGMDRFFTHGLGHGVGLEVHEGPRLSPRSSDVLEPGNIVTVEPGLYVPGWGGIRWEDMVLVTEDGCRVL